MRKLRKLLALGIFRFGAFLQLAGTPQADKPAVKKSTDLEYQQLKASFD